MPKDKIEELISVVYERWKARHQLKSGSHPDEEELASFVDNNLSEEAAAKIKEHIILCNDCAEAVLIHSKLIFNPRDNNISELTESAVPDELRERLKVLIQDKAIPLILEVTARLKDKFIELIDTTGDILIGQEFVPAAVMRARNISDFKNDIEIFKVFKDVRVEIKIENRPENKFSLTVAVKDKITHSPVNGLRVTLFRNEVELESYLSRLGKAIFENITVGRYSIEITSQDASLASILLEVKI